MLFVHTFHSWNLAEKMPTKDTLSAYSVNALFVFRYGYGNSDAALHSVQFPARNWV